MRTSSYMYASEHDIGKPVEIYYDGNDPNIISVPDDVKSKVSVKLPLGIVISAIPIVAFLFLRLSILHRKSHKPKIRNQISNSFHTKQNKTTRLTSGFFIYYCFLAILYSSPSR